MRFLTISTVLIIFLSCNNYEDQKTKKTDQPPKEEARITSAFSLEPRFAEIDSMQVLFFDDPYGDSIRYTRFFRFVNSNNPDLLDETRKHLHQPYTIKSTTDTCRSEGKIFLLAKGEPVKTLYFSTGCPSCCYTYFIKDGNFYYFELNDNFLEKISALKKIAKTK